MWKKIAPFSLVFCCKVETPCCMNRTKANVLLLLKEKFIQKIQIMSTFTLMLFQTQIIFSQRQISGKFQRCSQTMKVNGVKLLKWHNNTINIIKVQVFYREMITLIFDIWICIGHNIFATHREHFRKLLKVLIFPTQWKQMSSSLKNDKYYKSITSLNLLLQ